MNKYFPESFNCIIILGPTAVGKTGLAVKIADYYSGHIVSADSRQVYKGLDIGSGKDLNEFTLDKNLPTQRNIPYHLIDIVDVKKEYSVFDYQQDFYKVFTNLINHSILPVVVGGTGMYLDAIIRGYELLQVPVNTDLRKAMNGKSLSELTELLQNLKKQSGNELHNNTDLTERHRLLRAIEIETFNKSDEAKKQKQQMNQRPDIKPIIIGTTFERTKVRDLVTVRLHNRISEGMIEEVKKIHDSGISWERLERLGLEYKYVSEYLQNKFTDKDEFELKLNIAIHQFVKRQETWFRGMERKGVQIHWLKETNRFEQVVDYINSL